MFRIKHSIGRKFARLLFVVLLLASLMLSVSFYYISVSTFNSNVLPQIDKQLTSSVHDVYKNLNTTHAQQAMGNNQQSITNLGYYFKDKRNQLDVDNIFLAVVQDGQATVVTAEQNSKIRPGSKLEVTPAMEQALKGKTSTLSEVYTDDNGVHKTAYLSLSGTPMVIGVNADVSFIATKMNSILIICVIITLAALIIGMTAALLMSRRITRPITQLAAYSNKLAQGDFTEELSIKGTDEVGQLSESFRTMTLRLKEMIEQVLTTSDAVVEDANDLKSRVKVLNGMAEQSAESVSEIAHGSAAIANSAHDNSRAMEEINHSIQHIASAAGEVTEQISEASAEALGGNETAKIAMGQMRQIAEVSRQSLKQFQIMNERSQQIGEVVQGIMEITKQIQMLSLNASIEAARAGEHGRGFAVVAGEVRKLSEQSKHATDQIGSFLLSLQEDMKRSASEMNHVNTEVASGLEKALEAGDAFNHLMLLIQNIDQSIQSVSAATQQISAGSEEVSASVEETAQITGKSQSNAETLSHNSKRQAEELEGHSLTVEHLHEQATRLQQAVKQFKI